MKLQWWRRRPPHGAGPRMLKQEGRSRFRPVVERLESRALPSVQLVSQALPGGSSATPNGASSEASVSADGRFVAFQSAGTNLVAGQTDGGLFLYDRLGGTTAAIILDKPRGLNIVNSDTNVDPVLSPDGRYIAFLQMQHQQGAMFTTDETVLMIYDRSAGTFTKIEDSPTPNYSFSADGRYLVFVYQNTFRTPAVPPVGTAPGRSVAGDDVTGVTTLASHNSSSPSTAANGSSIDPAISADGRYIAYSSDAPDLVAGAIVPSGTFQGVYFYDRTTGANRLVSHDSASTITVAPGISDFPVLSGNGAFLAYTSTAIDVVPGQIDTNGTTDVFLYATAQDRTTLVSHDTNSSATAANSTSSAPGISSDGNEVAYQSYADRPGCWADRDDWYPTCSFSMRASGTNILVSHVSGFLAYPSFDPVISTDAARSWPTSARTATLPSARPDRPASITLLSSALSPGRTRWSAAPWAAA